METDIADVEKIRKAVPDNLLLIGSGSNPDNVSGLLKHADGAIVGTYLKKNGMINRPIDLERVTQMSLAIKHSS